MLTLFEDEAYINECFKNYLTETKVLDWKYEKAVKQILDLGFHPDEVETDLEKLGAMYKSVVNDIKDMNSATYSEAEKQKVTDIIKHMKFLCTAAPIKKLFNEKKWRTEYLQNLEISVTKAREEEGEREKKKAAEKKFYKLSSSEKFAHLGKYYGNDGVLDLQKATIPRRFQKHMVKMKEDLDTVLQPLITLEEREMLVEISKCRNTSDIQKLLTAWYNKEDLTSNCRFIRFALAAGLETWNSKALMKKGHGEDWYRMHVYSNVWDKAFFDDDEFETKRSECLSQVMKVLKEIDGDTRLQKLDFILRDLNTDNDVITAEEKPTSKGVKADVRKGGLLKKNTLYLWSKQVKSHVLMEELESLSCQWQGTKLTVYGSRLLSSDLVLTYVKGSFQMPVSVKHLPEFSKLLMAVISVKRVAKLSYAKFTLILEEKYKQEIEDLAFDDDLSSEVSFVSNSTDTDSEEGQNDEEESENDVDEFVERTLAKVKNLKLDEEGLKKFSDWEDLLLYDRAKRRRTNR